MSKATLETRINSLKKSGQNIQSKIHALAIECLIHAQENDGDFTMLSKLYHALPAIVRRGTFVEWVKAYSPSKFVTKKTKAGADIKLFRKSKSDNANPFDINGAMDMPIHNFDTPKGTNEAEPLTCDKLDARIVSYITKLQKDAEKLGNREGVIHLANTLEKIGNKAA